VSSTPGWFGDVGQFGWVHLPDTGRAAGGVLLCPSLGSEAEWSHHCLRLLADELESRHLAVVRFDYPGLGHGAGDLRTTWTPGVLVEGARNALNWLRGTGACSVAALGFRLGATIAAHLAAEEHEAGTPLDGLVMWNPVLSGRQFLREHRAIRRFAEGLAFGRGETGTTRRADDFGVGGYLFPPACEADLAALDMAQLDATALPAGLLMTEEAEEDSWRQRLPWARQAEWVLSEANALLFDWTNPPPTATISAAAAWLQSRLTSSETEVRLPPLSSQIMLEDAAGGPVRERIQWLGPLPCFGVETAPAGAEDADARPSVALLNTSTEPSVGPARLWVEVARLLAGGGARVLRVDLSGLGDSPAWAGQPRFTLYQPQAITDLIDVIRAWSPSDPGQVLLAGVCSGAYNVLEAASRLGSRKVIAVNPVTDAPIAGGGSRGTWSDGQVAGGRRASVPRRWWLRAIQETGLARRLRRWLPPWAWRALDAARIQPSPARALLPLAAAGTQTVLVCGPDDAGRFERRGGWLLRRLVDSGRLQFVTDPHLDHSALLRDGQRLIRQTVLQHAGSLQPLPIRRPGATLG
jgi:alpha/beta superfamily hydrolase